MSNAFTTSNPMSKLTWTGSCHMLEHADALLAVWDGQPARGYGGTADVVEIARQTGTRAIVIWPDGARRD